MHIWCNMAGLNEFIAAGPGRLGLGVFYVTKYITWAASSYNIVPIWQVVNTSQIDLCQRNEHLWQNIRLSRYISYIALVYQPMGPRIYGGRTHLSMVNILDNWVLESQSKELVSEKIPIEATEKLYRCGYQLWKVSKFWSCDYRWRKCQRRRWSLGQNDDGDYSRDCNYGTDCSDCAAITGISQGAISKILTPSRETWTSNQDLANIAKDGQMLEKTGLCWEWCATTGSIQAPG